MNSENENREETTEETTQEQTGSENTEESDANKEPITSTEEGEEDIRPLGQKGKTNFSRG